MIIITGAAGFIGSCLTTKLINEGYNDLVLIDDFSKTEKAGNIKTKSNLKFINRNDFFNWIDDNHKFVQFIFHLGARTDTSEFNVKLLNELNTEYSKLVWQKCCIYGIPLLYASSAATYGIGNNGYSDNHKNIEKLKPLTPYGVSKNEFDKWVLKQEQKPFFWTGLKFFNVYGPNEYHKQRMASVIFHAYNQIKKNGSLKLFKSHNSDYRDGEQKRDFIYIKDVVDVLFFVMLQRKYSGIFNLGTGKARTFLELAKACFKSMNKEAKIEFIETPTDIRDKYQYFTQADISKLIQTGYNKKFYSLEEGINDYVKNYLQYNKYYDSLS